jgi:hypothetical protein
MPRIEQGLNPATGLSGMESRMAELQQAFTDAIQLRLDAFARTRGYDNADSTAKYLGAIPDADDTEEERGLILKFAAEAAYMQSAVSRTWAKSYVILNAVLSGQRPMPSQEEVFAELPPLAWPEG